MGPDVNDIPVLMNLFTYSNRTYTNCIVDPINGERKGISQT